MKYNFIRTSSSDTASMLRELGFKELPKQGEFFCFINNSNKPVFFSEDEKKTVNYSNMMYG